MATTINASNSSGLAQTADTSGILQLQTNGVTALQIDASQNVTFTNTPSASSMTLLGTITPTAVNSLSLGSLTLTGYKSLYIALNNINDSSASSVNIYVSSTNVQSGGGVGQNVGGSTTGVISIELTTGALGGSWNTNTVTLGGTKVFNVGGLTNVTTSSTIIYFRLDSTNTFTAQGSIVIYGVK